MTHNGGEGSLTKPSTSSVKAGQPQYNKHISAIRAPAERTAANPKTRRIPHTDYRRPLHTHDDTPHATLDLHRLTTTQHSA
jgi:hypothetical protein